MHDGEYDVLRRMWFPVARLADFQRNVLRGNILGTELVIYRVGEEITVADGYCPHRGMALGYGSVIRAGLECPYHGWVFAARSGECTEVPSLPRGVKPPRVSLRTYPSQVAYGLVWSCLGPPLIPLPELPEGGGAGWQLFTGKPYDLRCGMRQLTENFRDRAHFPFVHATTMGELPKVVDSYQVARDGWQLTWSSAMRSADEALTGPESGVTMSYRTVLPMFASVVVRGSQGDERLVVQLATPTSADGESVRQFWLVGIDHSIQAGPASIETVADYERQVFEEDHWIVENQRPAEAPLALKSQAHTAADHFSIAYRRAYLDLLTHFAAEFAAADP